MCLSTIACVSLDYSLGFAVKNATCFYGLEKVRSDLQNIVTEVALSRFGSFVAPLVGNQVGLMLAMPVTIIYGEMMSFAIRKTVKTIYALFMCFLYDAKSVKESPPLCRDIVISIVSFVAGFFAKTYFCNYGMGYVSTLLKHSIVIASPVLGLSLPLLVFMPAIVVLITPAVTFVLGDFVAFSTNQAIYHMLSHSFSQRSKPLLPT